MIYRPNFLWSMTINQPKQISNITDSSLNVRADELALWIYFFRLPNVKLKKKPFLQKREKTSLIKTYVFTEVFVSSLTKPAHTFIMVRKGSMRSFLNKLQCSYGSHRENSTSEPLKLKGKYTHTYKRIYIVLFQLDGKVHTHNTTQMIGWKSPDSGVNICSNMSTDTESNINSVMKIFHPNGLKSNVPAFNHWRLQSKPLVIIWQEEENAAKQCGNRM